MEKVINPKRPIYLFNKENPKGQMLPLTESELKEKLDDGWFDSPSKLNLPSNDDTGVSLEQAQSANPSDLVKLVESFGFIVLTPEQLKAEAVKMADVAFDVQNLSDEMLIQEAERRGLKEQSENQNAPTDSGEVLEHEFLAQFKADPESLNIDELVKLGNDLFKLSLRTNMLEATLIAKIQAALNEAE